MYSAIKADVPVESDKSTQKNPVLMQEITAAKQVWYTVATLNNVQYDI